MNTQTDWLGIARELGPGLAARAAKHDADGSFVQENYALLKEKGLFSAGVPGELGGGDASHAEVCAVVRELARQCSSTGLAFSMHSHLVATLAWMWRNGNKGPEGMLKRVAAERLVLVSSGGSDWLPGSGRLEKTEGGYRMTGRKIFSSGVPGGDVLMTTGVYDDPKDGPTVIHFPLPLRAEGVKVLDTWHVLGMRGTGSHDVQIDGAFIPDAAAGGVRRPVGKWHPFMHTICLAAVPVFYGAYVGVAQAARDVAIGLAAKKKNDPSTAYLVGEMENQFVTAELAHAGLVEMARTQKPGPETTAQALCRRTILANAVVRTVEKAMEVAGGSSYFESCPLERLFRDAQAVRFHPVQEKPQTRYVGRHLLGLPIDE